MTGISKSIQRTEQIRTNFGSRGSAVMAQAIYFYYMGVDFENNFGSIEKAFEYSESMRNRGFLEQMGTETALELPGITADERQKVQSLTREIENRQDILYRYGQKPPQNRDEEMHYVNTAQTLTALEAELNDLDIQIGNRIPRYGEYRNPKPVSLIEAQQWCGDDQAVLEYVLWDDSIEFIPLRDGSIASSFTRPTINSYCLVLTNDGLVPVILDHDFDYMGAINRLRKNITGVNRIGSMEMDRNELYNALIKPVLPYIPENVKELLIVPDATLGHLPFDVLREDYSSPDLGETYRITLSPSVSVSMLAEKTKQQNIPVMAFGGAWYNPNKTAADRSERGIVLIYDDEPGRRAITWRDLPGTEIEVQNLEKLISSPDKVKIFRGSDVSEAMIKDLSSKGELAKYPILHFACHGYFNEEDAERSGIVLSEVSGLIDTGEDGYLTIPEIVLLNLDAKMILLSACETGLGVLKRGDGMVGMARAFLVTGAENVGVSLWSIDDEATQEFMTLLYNKVLNEGQTFKEAYYLVKNEFRKEEKWNHPYYWAAFTIYE